MVVADMTTRRVLLRVENVPWMQHYHGREAGLVGQVVAAVELETREAVAYVDDRDGEASDLLEALEGVTNPQSPVALAARRELQQRTKRWALHGRVTGVRV